MTQQVEGEYTHKPSKNFAHIYVERGALDYPDCQTVLERFPNSERIIIDDYKEVFNRPKQNWAHQKRSKKLILAVKKSDFLYPGSPAAPDFGHQHFYYNSLMLNCLYDCHYCYLQGMYPSANIVMFVNNDDFLSATKERLVSERPLYLCISYDTDLLAFEYVLPYCDRWIRFAQEHPELTIELRTKSANFNAIDHLTPSDNVILAWTVSPHEVAQRYERAAATLKARLLAMKHAAQAGWQLRVCVDPILRVENWASIYGELVEQIFEYVQPDQIRDVSLGAFRMNSDYFRRAKRSRNDSELFFTPFEKHNSLTTYRADHSRELISTVSSCFEQHMPRSKVIVLDPPNTFEPSDLERAAAL